MNLKVDVRELEKRTSAEFVAELERYMQWAENNGQARFLDAGMMENESFFSTVIVTSENIIQLIFNKENRQITVGTASRDACEYAMGVWNKVQEAARNQMNQDQNLTRDQNRTDRGQ